MRDKDRAANPKPKRAEKNTAQKKIWKPRIADLSQRKDNDVKAGGSKPGTMAGGR